MTITYHSELPVYVHLSSLPPALNQTPTEQAHPVWSSDCEVPRKGQRVRVTVNGLGTAVVAGYFVEEGWLGVLVDLDTPKKNNGERRIHAFGAEIAL